MVVLHEHDGVRRARRRRRRRRTPRLTSPVGRPTPRAKRSSKRGRRAQVEEAVVEEPQRGVADHVVGQRGSVGVDGERGGPRKPSASTTPRLGRLPVGVGHGGGDPHGVGAGDERARGPTPARPAPRWRCSAPSSSRRNDERATVGHDHDRAVMARPWQVVPRRTVAPCSAARGTGQARWRGCASSPPPTSSAARPPPPRSAAAIAARRRRGRLGRASRCRWPTGARAPSTCSAAPNRTTLVTGPLGDPVEARVAAATGPRGRSRWPRPRACVLAGGAEGNDPIAASTRRHRRADRGGGRGGRPPGRRRRRRLGHDRRRPRARCGPWSPSHRFRRRRARWWPATCRPASSTPPRCSPPRRGRRRPRSSCCARRLRAARRRCTATTTASTSPPSTAAAPPAGLAGGLAAVGAPAGLGVRRWWPTRSASTTQLEGCRPRGHRRGLPRRAVLRRQGRRRRRRARPLEGLAVLAVCGQVDHRDLAVPDHVTVVSLAERFGPDRAHGDPCGCVGEAVGEFLDLRVAKNPSS